VSEGISLSDELISNVFQAVARHDAAAEKDLSLGLQYLSAIIGYLAAGHPGSEQERDDFLNQLGAFTKHVCDEQAAVQNKTPQAEAPQAAPAGRSVETDDPAMGIWTPE